MRVLLVAVALAVPAAARAQDPPAAPPAPPGVASTTTTTTTTTVVSDPAWPWAAPGREPLLGLDIMVGQQMGIRPSVAVFRSEYSAVVAEGFYGATLTRLGDSEAAGAGVRWNLTRGGRDSVRLGPGVDVLFNFDDGRAVLLAPTVDLAWRRDFGQRAGWELGINAGVGVGVSGRNGRDGDRVGGQVTPLISVFGGLRF